MANTNIETAQSAFSAERQEEATHVIRDAEGLAWDEFDRLCRGIGVSALAGEYVASDFRKLQIDARWNGETA